MNRWDGSWNLCEYQIYLYKYPTSTALRFPIQFHLLFCVESIVIYFFLIKVVILIRLSIGYQKNLDKTWLRSKSMRNHVKEMLHLTELFEWKILSQYVLCLCSLFHYNFEKMPFSFSISTVKKWLKTRAYCLHVTHNCTTKHCMPVPTYKTTNKILMCVIQVEPMMCYFN